MSATWDTLWQRLEGKRPVLSEQEVAFNEHRNRWIEADWLKETSSSPHATCVGCGENGCPIRFHDNEEGVARPLLLCPTCGPVAIPSSPRRWTLEIRAVLASISQALGIRGEPIAVMEGRLWKLGRLPKNLLSRDCYFVRPRSQGLTAALMTELDRHPKAILVVGQRMNREEQLRLPHRIVLVARDLFDFGEEGLQLDREQLQAIFNEVAGVKKKPTPKRRDTRLRGISQLQDYMTLHVQSAKDHLLETGELLPRPDQKILAKACRMSESAVSRCLNDVKPDSNLLRTLWNISVNPESLRAYGAAKRRR